MELMKTIKKSTAMDKEAPEEKAFEKKCVVF
jgi:hypothetical protein